LRLYTVVPHGNNTCVSPLAEFVAARFNQPRDTEAERGPP
jgi:hypothetical protein